MGPVKNPILKGFNPDPSIIRVGKDYYIATSTFEWFPGVQIHHSTDLVNWTLINRPLSRLSQLDMAGNPDSCGVWAPCLSYQEGVNYLVYTNVRSFDGPWKDTQNYLVTTEDIAGEWSDPVKLGASGFDGSLFHDDDGRSWFVSMLVDHRYEKIFGGITLQEYDRVHARLTGEVTHIFAGSDLGITEGPHLYKRGEYYYLLTAEGGTEYNHAVTLARSKDIKGPYEIHPQNPIITARYDKEWPLQKAGHADLVETPQGDWYATFLVGRPVPGTDRCILGRETALQPMLWKEDGWLYAVADDVRPSLTFENPSAPVQQISEVFRDEFAQPELDASWQSLRVPMTEDWCKIDWINQRLCLYGQESLSSFHHQSLIARRVTDFQTIVTTQLDFSPETFQQMAGLAFYYNTAHYHYCHVTVNDTGDPMLRIITSDNHQISEWETPLQVDGPIHLRGIMDSGTLQFSYSNDGESWIQAGEILDATILSDDYVTHGSDRYRPAFTGMFVGLCCQDLTGQLLPAHFHYFEYKPL